MEITIRKIAEQDAEAVAALSGQLGYSTAAPVMAQRIRALAGNDDHCAYAALAAEQLVAWIHGRYTLQLESDAFVEIVGLVVDEQHRGKGIGLLLIEEVKKWAREKAMQKVRVRCNTKRTDTHTFYQHIGFSETKEQKVFDCSL